MQRVNIIIDRDERKQAMTKAMKMLGINSFSALIRYLIKQFLQWGKKQA